MLILVLVIIGYFYLMLGTCLYFPNKHFYLQEENNFVYERKRKNTSMTNSVIF